VNIRAVWNKNLGRFQVEINHGERQVQLMTEQEYADFCANLDTEVRIAGWKLVLDGDDGSLMAQIKDYLRAVLASYMDAKRKGLV